MHLAHLLYLCRPQVNHVVLPHHVLPVHAHHGLLPLPTKCISCPSLNPSCPRSRVSVTDLLPPVVVNGWWNSTGQVQGVDTTVIIKSEEVLYCVSVFQELPGIEKLLCL